MSRPRTKPQLHLAGTLGSLLTLVALSGLLALPAAAQLVGGNAYPVNGVQNPPTSFGTIANAATYLTATGVTGTGQVYLELAAGYAGETGPVTIGAVLGASATLGVTFRPAVGYTALTAVAGTSTSPFTIAITGSYVTLDGQAGGTGGTRDWTIRCTGSGTSGYGRTAVRLGMSSPTAAQTDVRVRYCVLEGEAANTTSAIVGTEGGSTYTVKNVVLENNLIRSAATTTANLRAYGITLANITNAGNTGWFVRNNLINNVYANGIRLTGGFPAIVISGNEIAHTAPLTQTSATEFAGLYCSTSSCPGMSFAGNFIHDIQLTNASSSVTGIYIYGASSTVPASRIYNNRVSLGAGLSSTIGVPVYGMRDYANSGNLVNFDDNSVYIGGAPTSGTYNSAAFYRQTTSTTITVRNNVLFNARSNSGGTGTHWAIMIAGQTNLTINNNDYFANGTGGVLGTTDGTTTGNKTTLAAWKTAVPQDNASVSQNPNYLGPTSTPPDLHIDPAIPTQIESGGQIVSGIDNDFEGDIRYGSPGYGGTGSAPDIGADEFNGIYADLSAPAIVYTLLPNSGGTTGRSFTNVLITDPSGVNGTSGTRPRVYYKKSTNANTWADNTNGTDGWKWVEANGSTSPFDFSLDYSKIFGGVVAPGDIIQYFVVAQDLASIPNVGINAGTFAAQPATVDLTGAAFPIGGTINSYTIVGSISGSFTVGTGGTYGTLKAAFDDINGKIVNGAVTLTVLSSGTIETASAALNALVYDGGPWAITIKPDLGATPTITGAITGAVVKLNGADNVVIDGSNTPGGTTRDLTIANTSTSAATAAVWLSSQGTAAGCVNNVVKNCNLQCGYDQSGATATDTFGLIAAGTTIGTASYGADNDGNSVSNNAVTKCRYGIVLNGISGNANDSNAVSGNLVGPASFGPLQIGAGGIIVQYQNLCTITLNEVRCVGIQYADAAGGADRVGIGLGGAGWTPTATTVTNSSVTRNHVHDVIEQKTYSAAGITVAGSGTPSANVIANNLIHDVRANGTAGDQTVGLGIVAGDGDKVVDNTIYLAGDVDPGSTTACGVFSAGIRIASAIPVNLTLKDNIVDVDLTSNTSTIKHMAIVAPATSYAWGTGGSNNNDFYPKTGNPQAVLGGIGTGSPYAEVPTLAGWRTQFTPNQDAASISAEPPFASATDLHLRTDVPTLIESAGTPIAGVTNDYDGDLRNGSTPDIGADEGNFLQLIENDIAASAFVNPVNGGSKSAGVPFNPSASFENLGALAQSNVPVRFRIWDPSNTLVYSDSTTIAVLNPGSGPQPASFASVTLAGAGAYTMEARASNPGDSNPANNAVTGGFTASAPLAGTYLVGSAQPAPFTTLTTAIGQLVQVGMAGDVSFVLTDALYTTPSETFPIVIPPLQGAGPSARFTIKPGMPGVAIQGAPAGAVLVLNGADYVVIDGSSSGGASRDLAITNTSTLGSTAVVWLESQGAGAGATNNTVKNCVLACGADQAASGAVTNFGILSSGTSISTANAGADNDGNTFSNNAVTQVRHGIYVYGASGNPNDNVTISGNIVGPAAFTAARIGVAGIAVAYQNQATILLNEVRFVGSLYADGQSGTDRVGIGLGGSSWVPTATTVTNSTVARNLVHDVVEEKTYSAAGIVVAGSNGGGATNNVVANNMIYGVRANGTAGDQSVGLGIVDGNGDKIVYNTIAMTGDLDPGSASSSSVSSAGIRIVSATPSNLLLQDNAISVDLSSNTATLKHYAIVAPATSYAWGTGAANNNDYYPKAGNAQAVLGGIGTASPYTDVPTLVAWRTQFTPNQDAASISAEPPFVSATDLHLQTTVPTLLESGGTPVAGVTIDFDNEARNPATPDIGADEGTFTPVAQHDIAAKAFVEPVNGGAKPANVSFQPKASYEDLGLNAETNVLVRFRILTQARTEVYNDTTRIASIAPGGGAVTATFSGFTPTAGGTYTMVASVELPGDNNPANDAITGTFDVIAPLAGVYNVGSGQAAPYNTLTGAVARLNQAGIAASVTFVLTDALYDGGETFPITINPIAGGGAGATFTLKPGIAGVAITGASASGVLVLNGADYVTIDGAVSGSTRDLTITNTSTAGATAAVWLSSQGTDAGCTHDTVKNCGLACGADQSTSANETFGILSSGTALTTSSYGADNENNAFVNNAVTKARWGIYVLGIAGNLNENNLITDNLVGPAAFGASQIGKGGIVVQYQNQATVSRNEVRYVGVLFAATATGSDRIGIGLGGNSWTPTATTVTGSTVTRNRVHHIADEKTFSAAGIVVAGAGLAGPPVVPSANLVANNMIHDVWANGTYGDQAVGIGIAAGDGDIVADNSVAITGDMDPGTSTASDQSAACIRISSATPANLTFKDNVLLIDATCNTTTIKHYAVIAPAVTYAWGTGACDFNDYFPRAENAQAVLGGIGTAMPYTEVPTLQAWRTQFTPPEDAASLSADPLFVSASDLHIVHSGQAVSPVANAGTPIAGVTTDFDGDTRTATPDMGADEFTTYALLVTAAGHGHVTRDPDLPTYNPGSSVLLTAVADSGWVFASWSGDASGSDNPKTITMDGNKNITATFTLDTSGAEDIPAFTYMDGSVPNPSNGPATIRFGLREPGPVTLEIYDVQGRAVRSLAHGTMPRGHKRLTWDGRDDAGRQMSAGFYVLRMKTKDKTFTKTLVRIQ